MKEKRTPRKGDEPLSPRRDSVRPKPVAAGRREPDEEAEERTPEEAGYGYGV